MDFTKDRIDYDEDGQQVIVTENYTLTLDNGVAEISLVTDTETVAVCTQPWKPNSDGSRSDWISETEVAEWFKQRD